MTYTITAVTGPREWEGKYGVNHDYVLSLEDEPKQVFITQRPTTPAPVEGQQIELELVQHPRFPDKLKGTKPNKQMGGPGGGGGFRPRDPAERKSIEMQASHKVAVDIARLAIEGLEVKPDSEQITQVVMRTARALFDQIEEVAK